LPDLRYALKHHGNVRIDWQPIPVPIPASLLLIPVGDELSKKTISLAQARTLSSAAVCLT